MRRSGGCSVVPAGCRDGGEPGSLGGLQTTFAATASCPSRNTVAVIGRCAPTPARAEKDPHDTTGATTVMPRRRSGRPVITPNASEVAQREHVGVHPSWLGRTGTIGLGGPEAPVTC